MTKKEENSVKKEESIIKNVENSANREESTIQQTEIIQMLDYEPEKVSNIHTSISKPKFVRKSIQIEHSETGLRPRQWTEEVSRTRSNFHKTNNLKSEITSLKTHERKPFPVVIPKSDKLLIGAANYHMILPEPKIESTMVPNNQQVFPKSIETEKAFQEMLSKEKSESLLAIEVNKSKRQDFQRRYISCLLYTSDAADDTPCVDLGGRRNMKKKKNKQK
eukprot:TRINITY_DN13531_c0_g1_i1.p1 TRINITY_DN13531_c0_g1~~TRINITY_DN13531_c0_g1_i1.p1  ORF type:complete len:247 (-),score=56.38 TRINITY_DN13531_c0_g1_i1:40-699(-)